MNSVSSESPWHRLARETHIIAMCWRDASPQRRAAWRGHLVAELHLLGCDDGLAEATLAIDVDRDRTPAQLIALMDRLEEGPCGWTGSKLPASSSRQAHGPPQHDPDRGRESA